MSSASAPTPAPAKRRPRLAYLFSRYPVISQTFVDNEILGLEAAGWDVVICSLHPPRDGLRHPRLSHLRAPILYAPPPEAKKGIENHLKGTGDWPQAFLEEHAKTYGAETRPELSCRNAAHFAEVLPLLGVDHVHMHFANRATHAALMIKEMAGLTFSFTPQAQDFLIDISSPELLGEMCRQAQFVVVACDWARRELLNLVPGVDAKVFRIYNGIDPAPYTAANPDPRDGTLKIASVGRLIEFKGFHHLIAAMAQIRERGVTVQLDLMGDGPWRARLETMVRDLGLESQVVFHGSVKIDQMRECFGRIDAFVLACIADTKGAMDVFPTVITEAMLSSLPVISCRIAGVPEQVIDDENGLVVAPADEAALADALYRMATEPGLAVRMGEAGRRRAMDLFAIDKTLPLLEAELSRVPDRREAAERALIGAFYDLTGGAGPLLEDERKVLTEFPAQIWVAGGTLTHKEANRFAPAATGAFWLPDGMVLETEWMARADERAAFEPIYAEIKDLVSSEDFFDAARRALWISAQGSRLGLPRLWYAPSEAEALVIWLLHRLTGVPFVLGCDLGSGLTQVLARSAKGHGVPRLPEVPKGGASVLVKMAGAVQRWSRSWRQAALRAWLRKSL